jgi:hypothetical protein
MRAVERISDAAMAFLVLDRVCFISHHEFCIMSRDVEGCFCVFALRVILQPGQSIIHSSGGVARRVFSKDSVANKPNAALLRPTLKPCDKCKETRGNQ